jgi:threonine dehydrogenase-like Zn-dependent dehydrogenase
MFGAVIEAPRRMRLEELPEPTPGKGQVRIKVEGCGICGSNLPTWEGRSWFKYPIAAGSPGHEGWGTVDAVGEGVRGVSVGERVAMLSYNAFAQSDLAAADHVVTLPPALRGEPFPGEALACAMNIFERARIESGQRVAIVGVGFLGAVLAKLASDAGARVVAISRRRCALDLALDFGAEQVCTLNEASKVTAQIMEWTAQRGCECVIEAVGIQETLDLATALTAERGRLIIAGYHQDSPRSVDMQLWNWRGLDVINAHERDPMAYVRGMRRAVDWVARGGLDLGRVCTHAFPLARLAEAFDAVIERRHGLVKAWVSP